MTLNDAIELVRSRRRHGSLRGDGELLNAAELLAHVCDAMTSDDGIRDRTSEEPAKSLFREMDRVRVKYGRDAGHYGTITHVGGDDGTYYGVKLDCHDKEVGYSEYELEQANPDEPAWVTRFAKGKADCSPFVAKEIADQVRELLIYKRAMESMAAQFIHPKMTAREMAEAQLKNHQ